MERIIEEMRGYSWELLLDCTCNEVDDHTEDVYHICPYKEDIDGDSKTLCSCCEYCTQQCADDV